MASIALPAVVASAIGVFILYKGLGDLIQATVIRVAKPLWD